jgi:nucleoside-diphosphate-sugar epimerase
VKIVMTGATGFVGRHAAQAARARGHEVVALVRNANDARQLPWLASVRLEEVDLDRPPATVPASVTGADAVVHLAWSGLPNYRSFVHVERGLPQQIAFLKWLLPAGPRRFVVAGTCLEYGQREGELDETMEAVPSVAYAIAKNVLRQFLADACAAQGVELRWARLFYTYGEGQNPNSLLAQLDRAIDNAQPSFDMSGGEQLRDYLPIEAVARCLVDLAEVDAFAGIVNICSGKPVSVRTLVERHVAARGARIALNLGFHPYPDYEPRAFWGSAARLAQLRGAP